MSWLNVRKVPILLALATLIPIGALTWLGARILQQDRELEGQRRRERLEVAAGRVALDIERHLQQIEDRLARGDGIRFTSEAVQSSTAFPVLYQPREIGLTAPPAHPELAAAEIQEFQRHNSFAAAELYRAASRSADAEIRAAALVGLGRALRQQGDRERALRAYEDLAALGHVSVAGQPAALVAAQGRCKVLAEARDEARLRTAAAHLAATLDAGGWAIDRATFMVYRSLVDEWGGPPPSNAAIAMTEAAGELWRVWRRGDLPARGRRVLRFDNSSIFAVWSSKPDAVAWFATAGELEHMLRPFAETQGLALALSDTDSHVVFGDPRSASISLTPGETRLPFILGAAALNPPDDTRESMRRVTIVAALSLAFLLMAAAAFGLYKVTTRELVLARQQSDFVSAVSHEFRTPLTSMRHLTDLLVARNITSEDRKTQYYELLAHETERLQRLVESLLSFGRIDAGAYAWKLEPADLRDIVSSVVDEFGREPIGANRQLLCDIDDRLPTIQADREALSRALWNLMENAAKYSEPATPIAVFAQREGNAIFLGVRDRGNGIPVGEHEKIFQKFVRGAEAKRAGVRGVGIGLALVRRIVQAHGGSIRLDSEPGRGSTFTLVLPCRES